MMGTGASKSREIVLSMQDLREVTRYAAESAQEVLEIFERAHPADPGPRDAIDAAWTFARGGKRGKTLRDTAWAAHKAARDAGTTAAGDAARAAELVAGDDRAVAGEHTLSKRAGARHRPSSRCSNATPRHRLAEAASGRCFAVWMRPSAAVAEGRVD
jgi:hypothetical protein